jgi:hypothetical protein
MPNGAESMPTKAIIATTMITSIIVKPFLIYRIL